MRYVFPLSPWNQQRQFQKPVWVYPVHLAMYATYLRDKGHEVIWGSNEPTGVMIENDSQIDVPFGELPYPDRILTQAKDKRWQAYGNYKYHPATHMMVSNLCWWGKCVFCEDKRKLDSGIKREVRSVDHVMEEMDDLILLGYKEVFDDSGTFPVNEWLDEFLKEKKKRDIVFGCNLRPIELPFREMKEAGFRLVLVGLESANKMTLERLNKGYKDNIGNIKKMYEAGLEVHITVMFGYPWQEDPDRTISKVYTLLKNGWVKSVQASVYSEPRTIPNNPEAQECVERVYSVYRKPWFWWRKIKDIRTWQDFTYLVKRLDHTWK